MKWKPDMAMIKKWRKIAAYILVAAGINFVIEAASRHSLLKAVEYLTQKPLVYGYNTLLILVTYLIVYLVRRKVFSFAVISFVWLLAGIANGIILSSRVTPLTGPDLRLIKDAFAIMSLYMNAGMMAAACAALVLAIAGLVMLFKKMPKYQGTMNYKRRLAVTGLVAAGFVLITHTAIEKRVITTFFSNIAYAYQDYGFPYCFTTSVFGTGIDEPNNYGEKNINKIMRKIEQDTQEISEDEKRPNIIFVQLETFFDPMLLNCITLSEDPIPNFRQYMEEYSSGYFEVPVVGAGTANTEFETIVGMNLRYFGPGEYPYKTILKKTTCESMAYALKNIGYTAHALHNNTAEFYGRNEVFANLGFDTFTSIETMNCMKRNPIGWADDSILTKYILDCMKSSEGEDYIYAISVQGHGAYPEEPVLTDPHIKVLTAPTPELKNQYEYYVNQLYEMDQFVKELITAIQATNEKTVVVMYGDHLPTLGLRARDMKNGHLYSTEYFIWDNIGLERKEKNIPTYQMGAEIMDRLGIHEGVMMQYHQKRKGTKYYMQDMEMLQYDMLYGKQYVFEQENPYEQTELLMGINQPKLRTIQYSSHNLSYLFGENFTQYCKVYVNGEEKESTMFNDKVLILRNTDLQENDQIQIKIINSEEHILCETEEFIFRKNR